MSPGVGGELSPTSVGLIFMSGATASVAATKEKHLDYLAREVRGPHTPGTQWTVTVRETVLGRLPPPRALHGQQTEMHPSSF